MKTETDGRQVTISVNSTDQYHGRPLYAAIVQRCQERGIAGASVIRCLECYGAHHKLHTPRLIELSENLPIHIDIVDVAERIDPLLSDLAEMIGEGLVVTVAPVHIIRLLHHTKGS